jgi:hypothetical protein
VIDTVLRRSRGLAVPALAALLAGCGASGSGSSGFQTLSNVVMFQSTQAPSPDQLPTDEEAPLVCPEVIIEEGGAAIRAQSGTDAGSLRSQISLLNVARECTPTGDGGFRLKVGVEGRILLGPAGGAGSYGATLTTRVLRGTTQVARRISRVGGTIPSGQSGADFAHVEDGIVVPPGRSDVEIIVSLSPGAPPARGRRR